MTSPPYTRITLDAERLQLAADFAKRGEFESALAELKALLDGTPEHVLALGMQAAIHAQLGMTERAAVGFQRVLDIEADNPLARAQLALLRLQGGHAKMALEVLRPALDKPGDYHMQYLAGLALIDLGRLDEAQRCLELADREMPYDDPARPALAEALVRHRGRQP